MTATREVEEWAFLCPLCDGNGSATNKPNNAGEWEWFINCRSAGCASRRDYLFAVAKKVKAFPDYLKANPKRWLEAGSSSSNGDSSSDKPPDPLPTPRDLQTWQQRLALRTPYLKERGLKRDTWESRGIGYAERGEVTKAAYGNYGAFTFPVYEDGQLVNLMRRFYPVLPTNRKGKQIKYIGLHGRGSQLYPCEPDSDLVYVVEGIFDVLVMRQLGLNAVAATNGTTWNDAWTSHVDDCEVAICYDPEGLDKARVLAGRLETGLVNWAGTAAARSAYAVDLSPLGLEGKQDLAMYFTQSSNVRTRKRDFLSACRASKNTNN